MFDWLWQALLSNWIYDGIVLAAGGALFWAKFKNSRLSEPVLYGLAAAALTAVLLAAIHTQHKLSSDQAALTTPENVQERVRIWIDNFNLSVRNAPEESSIFRYSVQMSTGVIVNVLRSKDHARYLTFTATISLGEADKQFLKALSPVDYTKLIRQLNLALSERAIDSRLLTAAAPPQPLEAIYVEKRLPITGNLDEGDVIRAIDEIDYAFVAVRDTFSLAVGR